MTVDLSQHIGSHMAYQAHAHDQLDFVLAVFVGLVVLVRKDEELVDVVVEREHLEHRPDLDNCIHFSVANTGLLER